MKRRTRRILLTIAVTAGLVACGLAWIGFTLLSPNSARNRASAIACTQTWGRLAPFPPSATRPTIQVEGSIFTRAFRTSFMASPPDIERWLAASPGIGDAATTTPSTGFRRFVIKPGGGAQHAEVIVDDTDHRVSIYVYWS